MGVTGELPRKNSYCFKYIDNFCASRFLKFPKSLIILSKYYFLNNNGPFILQVKFIQLFANVLINLCSNSLADHYDLHRMICFSKTVLSFYYENWIKLKCLTIIIMYFYCYWYILEMKGKDICMQWLWSFWNTR